MAQRTLLALTRQGDDGGLPLAPRFAATCPAMGPRDGLHDGEAEAAARAAPDLFEAFQGAVAVGG